MSLLTWLKTVLLWLLAQADTILACDIKLDNFIPIYGLFDFFHHTRDVTVSSLNVIKMMSCLVDVTEHVTLFTHSTVITL